MAVYTDVSAEDLSAFLAGYDLGELLSYKGIAEGVENSNFPRPHRQRPLHPDAVRETGGGRRRAVLSRADGAPGSARHQLPAAGEEPQRRGARPAVRPAGRRRDFPRGHVDAAPGASALRRGRRGAGAHAPGRRRLRPQAPQCAVGHGLAAAVRTGGRARRQPAAQPARNHREGACASRKGLAARPAAGRDPRRPVSRQRVLSGRQALRPDRFLFCLHRHARLRRRHLPQRLVLRARSLLQRHQGPQPAWPPTSRRGRCRKPNSTRCRCWRAARRRASC